MGGGARLALNELIALTGKPLRRQGWCCGQPAPGWLLYWRAIAACESGLWRQAAMAAGMSRNASLPMHLKGAVVTATRQADVRRVIIAFDSVAVGRNLARWAFACCLFPDDVVHLVYCSNPKARLRAQALLPGMGRRMRMHTCQTFDAASDLSAWHAQQTHVRQTLNG